MKIDPYAWLLTVPTTIALVQLYFQPADHLLKRLWRDFVRCESLVWERMGWSTPEKMRSGHSLRNTIIFAAAVTGFAIASLASFGAFIGFVPSS